MTTANTRVEVAAKGPGLRRELGRLQSYATIIGVMIGAGIFVVTGQAGGEAGPGVVLGYVLLAPVILTTAMAYAVFLSTPLGERPGGAYIHVSRTFGSYFPGYLLIWMKWVAFIGALGVLSLSLGEYVKFLWSDADPVAVGVIALVVFYVVNLVGVAQFGLAQVAMFAVLIAAIVLLVVPGLFSVEGDNLSPFLPFGFDGVLAALPALFFAYAGFEALAQTAGETREARRSLPLIFVRGVVVAVFIYVAMSFVAFGVLPYDVLAQSDSAMADVAESYLPFGAAAIVAVGAIMAFTTSINGSLLVPSRILYVLAEDRVTPPFLAHVNQRWRTPDVALTISAAIAIFLLLTETLEYMLDVALQAMFILYAFHSLTMVALPFVRPRLWATASFRPPVWLMVVAGVFSAGCMVYFTWDIIGGVLDLMLIWAVAGTLLYVYSRWQGRREGFDYERRLVEEWVEDDVQRAPEPARAPA
jgi:APA family basic amino acid/polyamine antiporter